MYKLLNILFKKYTSQKKFYSYGGIDILIDTIFKNQKKGFYVDVGCSHPIKNNNTYLLFSSIHFLFISIYYSNCNFRSK